jgi:2-isopropylmalate synthase
VEQIECVLNKNKDSYKFETLDAIKLAIYYNINVLCGFEHFFDSYKTSKEYVLEFLKDIIELDCKWITLADTNGGTMPHEVEKILQELSTFFPLNKFGIHAHNDMDFAVANSIIAVRNGCRMIQGTWNGMGERCGNANLISIFCTLHFKLKFDCCMNGNFEHLTKSSNFIETIFGKRTIDSCASYVGKNAFSHKGGLHLCAVRKNPKFYEHINPDLIGNNRILILSDMIGSSSLIDILGERPDKKFLNIAKKIIIENKNKESLNSELKNKYLEYLLHKK